MYEVTKQGVRRAAISGVTSGNNTLIAAVTGKKIRVLGLSIVAAGAVDFRLESGASGTALSGVMSLNDGVMVTWPIAPPGAHWVETAAGALLNMELGAGVQVSGVIVYYVE